MASVYLLWNHTLLLWLFYNGSAPYCVVNVAVAWCWAAVKLSLPLWSFFSVQAASGCQSNWLCTVRAETENTLQKVMSPAFVSFQWMILQVCFELLETLTQRAQKIGTFMWKIAVLMTRTMMTRIVMGWHSLVVNCMCLCCRPHTLHGGGNSRSLPSTVTVMPGDVNSPYHKQFVHSKSQQYRRLKTEWRNNVYLRRSNVQVRVEQLCCFIAVANWDWNVYSFSLLSCWFFQSDTLYEVSRKCVSLATMQTDVEVICVYR